MTANRIWALFFGAGLCRSAGDFGGQNLNALPTKPPLSMCFSSSMSAKKLPRV
ncbi:MAG: hypothetical protein ACKOHK_02415 [Planctomycetia bacterium]